MLPKNVYSDPEIYIRYYLNQAGHGLEGFHGAEFMHGAGLAGIFRGLFRRAVPLLRRGLEFVKPHVKTAARNIAKDAVTSVSTAVMDRINRQSQPQEGSGVVYIHKKPRKRKRTKSRIFHPLLNKTGPPKIRKRQKSTGRSLSDIF